MKSGPHRVDETDIALSVPLDGVQQIEASAGTGKTWTIAGIYARLVVERDMPLREILVMTFTKAATEELRQRLRERLLLCADLAASPWLHTPPADDALTPEQAWTLGLLQRALDGGEDPSELARRLRLVVLGMDEAAIFTIHGFCQRVLREHAVLVDGVASDVQLEPGDLDLLENFAADAWLRVAGDGNAMAHEALLKLGETPDDLARRLQGLVDFSGCIEPSACAPREAPPHPDSSQDKVFKAWADGAADAVALFAQAWTNSDFKVADYPKGSIEDLRELAGQLQSRTWPAPKRLQQFATSTIRNGTKVKATPFAGHAAFDVLDDCKQLDADWQDAVRAHVPVLLHALVDEARAWLSQRKRALARMSYADQIELVRAGVSGNTRGQSLRDALRRQYPVALVDEFQDTDARQFEIFERLYADFGALFCIGDPKQAIYAFRGGDVHAYLRAGELAAGHWSLDHNYRSSPGLLRAHVALFGQRADVFVEDGIDFEAVKWGGKTQPAALCDADGVLPPMTLWQLPDQPIKGGKDAARDVLAHACADEIARLLAPQATTLKGDPLQARDIAVLVNENAEAMRVQDALAQRGIAAACLRRESVYASVEAAELRQLLDALLAPRNARLARGALATHLLGRNLGDLQAMQEDDHDWRAELDDLRTRWLRRGVLAMLERLGERHAQRLLEQPGGERCLSNLMQLGDALQSEARRLATAHAQRDWLAQRMAQADDRNEEEQLRLDSDAERVQILTLHASKGLEYNLVFLPFAALMGAREPKSDELARFHRGDQLIQRYLGSAPLQSASAVSEEDASAKAAAINEDLAEGVRKLYVGVTRARHACWLSQGRPSNKFKHSVLEWVLPEGVAAVIAQAGGDVRVCDVPQRTPFVPAPAAPDGAALACRSFTRSMDRDWWVHSFSRLSEGAHEQVSPDVARADAWPEIDTSQPALSVGPRGARLGEAVHAALERVDFSAWAVSLDRVPVAQIEIVSQVMQTKGFPMASARDAAVRLVSAALHTPVVDDTCLADIASAQRIAEMQFHFGIADTEPQALLQLLHQHGYQEQRQHFAHVGARLAGLMNGFIDLVFVHAGRWWVVDYKTNHLGDYADDYAPVRLQRAVRASDYDLQYLIYTVALHRWLRQVRGAAYDYERDFGGVRYLFLRGMGVGEAGNGVFVDRPSAALIDAMDRLLQAPGVTA